jgi:cohesin complex subunit SA-1/2
MSPATSIADDVDLLRKQRDYLLEQLADFVAGGQFNTTNSVKRTVGHLYYSQSIPHLILSSQAFQSLITLYILFARDPSSPETSSALTSLTLGMDERLQHQCAGFIQAEAELFADELHERDAMDSNSRNDSPLSEQEGSSDEETPVKATWSKKSKQNNGVTNGGNYNQPKRNFAAELASEYDFISVVSYFLRAVNSGAINGRHSAVLLAYHGRLGAQFDHCLSTVISVLREEGMYKKNGALVERVVDEALRQVMSTNSFNVADD